MEKKKTVKEHYVPQFYLKNFTDNKGFLHVYDLEKNKYFSAKPESICFEKNLYETMWENANPKLGKFVLQNNIENTFCGYECEFAKILTKILQVCNPYQKSNALVLQEDEKDVFFRFIINLTIRHPQNMERLSLNEIEENNDVICQVRSLLNDMGLGGTESLCYAANKKVMLTYEFENSYPFACLETLRKFNYSFFYADQGCFITSNNPVCVGDDPAIADNDKTSIYVALSPKVSVIFGNYKCSEKLKNKMICIDEKQVENINRIFATYDNGKRFLIAESEDTVRKYIETAS